MKTTPGHYWGKFWLPVNEERKLYGRMNVTDDGDIKVEIGDDLTEPFEPQDPDSPVGLIEFRDDEDEDTQVVHGWLTSSPRAVTLVDAYTFHRSVARRAAIPVSEQFVRPIYGFRGAHVDETTSFNRVRFHVSGTEAWLNRLDFTLNGDNENPAFIEHHPSKFIRGTLKDGTSLRLRPLRDFRMDHTGFRLINSIWFDINTKVGAGWRELDRRYVTPMCTLATLCTERQAELTEAWVEREHRWLEVLGTGSTATDKLVDSLEPERVVVPMSAIGVEGIALWLDQTDKLGPLPPVVASSIAGSNTSSIETQVLELTTLVDGLHKRIVDSSKRKYNFRLAGLVDVAETVLDKELTSDRAAWLKAVGTARQDFGHRQNDFLSQGRSVDDLVVILKSLRYLFRVVLLLQTGIKPELLGTLIRSSPSWALFQKQAKRLMPELYGEDGMDSTRPQGATPT